MNPRERVLAILNRQKVDRIPVDIWYTPEISQILMTHFNVTTDLKLYKAMGLDKIVWIMPEYTAATPGRTLWGTETRGIDTGTAEYTEMGKPALKGFDTISSLDNCPFWPDPAKFDYTKAADFAKQVSKEYATLGPWVSFYEIYCQIRGMEQAMIDLVMSPEYAQAVLDRIEEIQTEMMKRLFQSTGDALDMVFLSDDMGSQGSLLLSPSMWDHFFKDRMKRWCDLIHSYGKKVFYHSDGAVEPLIPRLIEAGIDILNPIQHVCPGMEMDSLKAKYGDKLIFHGGVENQKVLPFGTADEVRAEVRDCLRTLGAGRKGFICSSCHNIQAGTPLENVLAMVETVKKEGAV